MKKTDFNTSLKDPVPPNDIPPLLEALWWDLKGDWDRAHTIAQSIPSDDGSRIHAYLHRVEGDRWNADYWYQRAGRNYPDPNVSLKDEWTSLFEEWIEG